MELKNRTIITEKQLSEKKEKPYDSMVNTISPLARKHDKKKWNKSAAELMLMVSFGVVFIAIFAYLRKNHTAFSTFAKKAVIHKVG